ncbi:MAG: hypothetical protein R2770_18760 [Acidimicrobiales bacterium]
MAAESPTHPADDATVPAKSPWEKPPSWVFHLALAVPLVYVLWRYTLPGAVFGGELFWIGLMLPMGVGWLGWLIIWSANTPRQQAWRWGIAPAMVIASATLAVSDVPLRVRFELNRSDFDEIVEGLEPAAPLELPDRVGTYEITGGFRSGANVILYERNGGTLLNDGGFAYLPHGPDDSLENDDFESPKFWSLGGGWYAWEAGW